MPPIVSVAAPGTPSIGDHALPEEVAEYQKFSMAHIATVARALPAELWHYTTAEGLVGIISDGKIFATQISCLNDSRDRVYFGDLILNAIKDRAKNPTDERLKPLHGVAIAALSNRDIFSAGYFVTCFSETADDLGQWRGYGNGEAGYAIVFNSANLVKVANAGGRFLVPMNYDAATHAMLATQIVEQGEAFFLQGLARGRTNPEAWALKFVYQFSLSAETFACAIKHPKFAHEMERRIGVYFSDADRDALIFKPRRSLLARHGPDCRLGLTSPSAHFSRHGWTWPGTEGFADCRGRFAYTEGVSRRPCRA